LFSLLTKYLVQYGHVCIPHIGRFEIVQQSPLLEVAEQRVQPPFFTTRYLKQDTVPDHQFSYLTVAAGNFNVRRELLNFGEELREAAKHHPVKWNGFGTLRFASNELVFEPESIQIPSLDYVPARKVMRENVQHNMLVGDREMSSQQVTDELNKFSSKRSWVKIIGWTILALAIIAIIFLLFQERFQTSSTGLRTLVSH
jgi:hypothetical protein